MPSLYAFTIDFMAVAALFDVDTQSISFVTDTGTKARFNVANGHLASRAPDPVLIEQEVADFLNHINMEDR